jgi:hypothetical protein
VNVSIYRLITIAGAPTGDEEASEHAYADANGNGRIGVFMHGFIGGFGALNGFVADLTGNFFGAVQRGGKAFAGFPDFFVGDVRGCGRQRACVFSQLIEVITICLFFCAHIFVFFSYLKNVPNYSLDHVFEGPVRAMGCYPTVLGFKDLKTLNSELQYSFCVVEDEDEDEDESFLVGAVVLTGDRETPHRKGGIIKLTCSHESIIDHSRSITPVRRRRLLFWRPDDWRRRDRPAVVDLYCRLFCGWFSLQNLNAL